MTPWDSSFLEFVNYAVKSPEMACCLAIVAIENADSVIGSVKIAFENSELFI